MSILSSVPEWKVTNDDQEEIVAFLLKDDTLSTEDACKRALQKVFKHEEWQAKFLCQEKVLNCTLKETICLAFVVLNKIPTEDDICWTFRHNVFDFVLTKLTGFQIEGDDIKLVAFLLAEISRKFFATNRRLSTMAEILLLDLIKKCRQSPPPPTLHKEQ